MGARGCLLSSALICVGTVTHFPHFLCCVVGNVSQCVQIHANVSFCIRTFVQSIHNSTLFATSGFMGLLQRNDFVLRRGCACPAPARGAYDASPDLLVVWGGDAPPHFQPSRRLRRLGSRRLHPWRLALDKRSHTSFFTN